MIVVRSAVINDIKSNFQKVKNILSAGLFIMALLGFAYFVYWCILMSDISILKYSQNYFAPLAKLLNPNQYGIEIYQNTSLFLFKLMIPTVLTHYLIDKIEDFILYQIQKHNDAVLSYRQNKASKKQKTHNDSNKYSITLSIDYVSEKQLSEITKAALNKFVFKRITKKLSTLASGLEIDDSTNLYIVSSYDLKHCDFIYDNILVELAHLEKISKKRFAIEFIPNLSTDAIILEETTQSTLGEYSKIKSCNITNKSLNTQEYINRYKNLKKEKYKKTPIVK